MKEEVVGEVGKRKISVLIYGVKAKVIPVRERVVKSGKGCAIEAKG